MKSTATPALAAFMIVSILGAVPAARAAGERTSEHSIIGLFSPDREQDLRDVMADVPEFQLVAIDYEHARATFRYDLPTLFAGNDSRKPPTPAEIEQRLGNLLSKASEGTFRLKLSPTLPREKLTRIDFTVGMCDCKGCRYAVYLALTKIDGVEQATVNKHGVVTAWIDGSKVDRAAIEKAINRLEKK